MKKILITGAGGFIGRKLHKSLVKEYNVMGVDLRKSVDPDILQVISIEDTVDILLKEKPYLVVHAAFKNKKDEDEKDADYLLALQNDNLRLLITCLEIGCMLVLLSSSAVYGNKKSEITEKSSLEPVSLYGIAKLMQENLALFYYRSESLQVSILRLFNVIGPGQRGKMVLPEWASQVSSIIKEETDPVINVGTLKTYRDFIDVRDVVNGIELIIKKYNDGEIYNVASGNPVCLKDVCDYLVGLSGKDIALREREPTTGKSDVIMQKGSFAKFRNEYGWLPAIHWKDSVKDLLNEYL